MINDFMKKIGAAIIFICMATSGLIGIAAELSGSASGEEGSIGPSDLGTRGGRGDTIYIDGTNGDDDTGDGTTGNPYKTIQKGIDESETDDTIIVRPGTYQENIEIRKPLVLRSESDDPGDTIIKANNTAQSVIGVFNNSITIRGFGIENAVMNWHSGIYLNKANLCTIQNNEIYNNSLGIYLDYHCNGNTLDSNTIHSSGIYGVDFLKSGNTVMRDNTLYDNHMDFYLWGDELSHYVHDIDTSNTNSGRQMHYLVDKDGIQVPADAGFIGVVNCTDITVRDQSITNNGYGVLFAYTSNSLIDNVDVSKAEDGIYLWNSSWNEIKNCEPSDNYWEGIDLKTSSNNNTIHGNTITENSNRGIQVDFSQDNTITGNQMKKNRIDGLYLYYTSHCTITMNSMSESDYGTSFFHASDNDLRNNDCYNNRKAGIYLRQSSWNTLDFNNIRSNRDKGIYLYTSSNNNLFANNTIHSNHEEGFYFMSNSNENILRNNTITDNTERGIYILSGEDNLVYNNYFSNEYNALTFRDNFFNITKTAGKNIIGGPYLGGNFWSDYDGNDTDRDGLGDWSYNITGGRKDHLPLVFNELPIIRYTYDPIHPLEDETVGFNASGSEDPDGTITKYHWDFGDDSDANGVTADHSYPEAGTYQLTLTLTDNDGATNKTSWEITVYDTLPPFITDFNPDEKISDLMNATRTFNVTVDQIVDVSWRINGKEVKKDTGVTTSSYTNGSSAGGIWEVVAHVENGNGTDTMTWDWHVIDFTIGPAGQLGGWPSGISVQDDHAYLLQGYGLNILNITGDEPVKISDLSLPDESRDLFVTGERAYVANTAGLIVVDISDPEGPEGPTILGSYNIADSEPTGVHVSGDHAYLACGDQGLVIVDISDPSSLDQVSSIGDSAVDVFVSGDHAYVIGFGSNMLWSFDVSDPEDPAASGELEINMVRKIFVSGNFAYIAGGFMEGLEIVNITDPGDPVSESITGDNDFSAMDVYVSGDHAFVAGRNDGFMIFDVSSPDNITEVANLEMKEAQLLDVQENNAYIVTAKDDVLQIVDISDPDEPKENEPFREPTNVVKVHTSENHLIMTTQDSVWIYNNSDPHHPVLMDTLAGIPWIADMDTNGDILYVINDTHLLIIDLEEPRDISIVGQYSSENDFYRIEVKNDIAYIIRKNRMEFVDVSNPAAPEKIDHVTLAGTGRDMYIPDDGNLVYYAYRNWDFDKGLAIEDISDPTDPLRLSTIQTTGDPDCIWVEGNTAFVGSNTGDFGDRDYHIESFDITDPYEPVLVGETGGRGYVEDIEVHGDLVLANIVNGSIHTWQYDPLTGWYTYGPICPTPHDSSESSMATAKSTDGMTVYTSEYTYGAVIQDLIRKAPKAILTLAGGTPFQHMCPLIKDRNITIFNITLTADAMDSWELHTVTYTGEGSGDEVKDIVECRLYLETENGTLLDTSHYSGDNGTVTFDCQNTVIPKGDTIKLVLVYEFETWNGSVPIKNFTAKISSNHVSASPMTAQFHSIAPDPKIYFYGGPVMIGSVWNIDIEKVYNTIQNAVDDPLTKDGHTILVCPGTYVENVKVYKQLLIRSLMGYTMTFVEAENVNDHVFTMQNDDIQITGFTIRNAQGLEKAGVSVEGTRTCMINNNYIHENNYGIVTDSSKNFASMSNIIVNNDEDGIREINGEHNTYQGCTISGNAGNGVVLFNTTDDRINANMIGTDETGKSRNANGLDGIRMWDGSTDNIINSNVISGNSGNGITITGNKTKSNTITYNTIGLQGTGPVNLSNGGHGIEISGGSNNNAIGDDDGNGNTISGNTGNGILITDEGTSANSISGNYIGTYNSITFFLGNGGHGIAITNGARSNNIGNSFILDPNFISGNLGNGILIHGQATTDNRINGNYIGTDPGGKARVPNADHGILITGGANSNFIGNYDNNLISANHKNGILIEGNGTKENHVEGNLIGTDVTGNSPLGNDMDGVEITNEASFNVIQARTSDEKVNVISGNKQNGIEIHGLKTLQNKVKKNIIGTNLLGNEKLHNGKNGVFIHAGARDTVIEDNLISGNARDGVRIDGSDSVLNYVSDNRIGTDINGVTNLSNALHGINITGGSQLNIIVGCIISGNTKFGNRIHGDDTNSNIISDNLIGTGKQGNESIPNEKGGILITDGAKDNLIGPSIHAESGNTISGNRWKGIWISGEGTDNTVINQNMIGTNSNGSAPVPNMFAVGVYINNKATSTQITRNVISGNWYHGIDINGKGIMHTSIKDNKIGTDAYGRKKIPNRRNGISITGGANLTDIANNLISGNAHSGVFIQNIVNHSLSSGNSIHDNIIGADIEAKVRLGNMYEGVYLYQSPSNLVYRNTISGNNISGMKIEGLYSVKNKIYENLIGTTGDGEYKLSNTRSGVHILTRASSNQVYSNTVSGNNAYGILLEGSSTRNNEILWNNLGTDNEGEIEVGNADGIGIVYGAHDNYVAENIISGNWENGVFLQNKGTQNNTFWKNHIGTDGTGTKKIPNEENGIQITILANGNKILKNVIGGNKESGISINGGIEGGMTKNNRIIGNYIGLNEKGQDVGNVGYGIELLLNTKDNIIQGNFIWNNGGGIFAAGYRNQILENEILFNKKNTGIHLDHSSAYIVGNTISGDEGDGIICENGSNPTIRYNNIHGNGGFDLNNLDPAITVDVRFNWWGSPDGGDATFNGNMDNTNMLSSEVQDIGGTVMNGTGAIGFFNDSIVVEYTSIAQVALTIFSMDDPPMQALENSTGDQYLLMVDETLSLTDITLSLFYTAEDMQGMDENALRLFWWDGTEWQKCDTASIDTSDTGNFSGQLSLTIDAASAPALQELGSLFIGIAEYHGPDDPVEPEEHTITISIDPIKETIGPGLPITLRGKITVDPEAGVEEVKIRLDGYEVGTAILGAGEQGSTNSFTLTFSLPVDLTEGGHIILVNVTLETGESAEKTSTITYTAETDIDEDKDEDDGISSGMMLGIVLLIVLIVVVILVMLGIIPLADLLGKDDEIEDEKEMEEEPDVEQPSVKKTLDESIEEKIQEVNEGVAQKTEELEKNVDENTEEIEKNVEEKMSGIDDAVNEKSSEIDEKVNE